MRKYIADWMNSRNLDKDFDQYPNCEFPECPRYVVDIHHNTESMRGKRKHNEDWSDLIWLCRKCHKRVHDNNTQDNRSKLSQLIQRILKK